MHMRKPPPRPWRESIATGNRFWLKVWPKGDCWEWRGAISSGGYGQFAYAEGGWTKFAHRIAYYLATNRLPEQLHHLCQHPWCVRPSHLLPVTSGEHRACDRGRVTHCKHGHLYDEKNTYWQKPLANGKTNGLRGCRRCHAIEERNRQRRLRAS